MAWQLIIHKVADKQLLKLDKEQANRVIAYLKRNLDKTQNPRLFGKALSGNKGRYWRYRVGSLRIITEIRDAESVVLVLRVAKRDKVYTT